MVWVVYNYYHKTEQNQQNSIIKENNKNKKQKTQTSNQFHLHSIPTKNSTKETHLTCCSFFFCMKYFFLTSCSSLAMRSISYLYSLTWDSYMFSSEAIACTEKEEAVTAPKQQSFHSFEIYSSRSNIPRAVFYFIKVLLLLIIIHWLVTFFEQTKT